MTEVRHTPGPWHVGAGNGAGSVFAESGRMRLEQNGTTLYPIAKTQTGWDEDEDAANACLIAAAPELLKACDEERETAVGFILEGAIHRAKGTKPTWFFVKTQKCNAGPYRTHEAAMNAGVELAGIGGAFEVLSS
jgi:hypothetical protein